MRFNLINSTSQDYEALFNLVDRGWDVPVLIYSKNDEMHDIAMVSLKENVSITISCRGICYNTIFIDNCNKDSQKEDRKRAFIRMCKNLDVYFFDNMK